MDMENFGSLILIEKASIKIKESRFVKKSKFIIISKPDKVTHNYRDKQETKALKFEISFKLCYGKIVLRVYGRLPKSAVFLSKNKYLMSILFCDAAGVG